MVTSVFCEKTRIFHSKSYMGKSWNFSKFTLKLRIDSDKILGLDNLLVAANLNR